MTPATAQAPGWTFECKVHFGAGTGRGKRLKQGDPRPATSAVAGSVPRVARLLALAHRFDALLASGEVKDYADLARLAGVSRPRVTQIMNLLHLAPDIQEDILTLAPVDRGRDQVTERGLRRIAAESLWSKQRALWRARAISAKT